MLVLCTGAQAGPYRFPDTGTPALQVALPDNWTHRSDEVGNDMLLNGAHTAVIVVTMNGAIDESVALDDAAAAIMKAASAPAPKNVGPVTISGFGGFMYDSVIQNSSGLSVNVHMYLVRLDAGHITAITLENASGLAGDDLTEANSVLNAMTLIGPAGK